MELNLILVSVVEYFLTRIPLWERDLIFLRQKKKSYHFLEI